MESRCSRSDNFNGNLRQMPTRKTTDSNERNNAYRDNLAPMLSYNEAHACRPSVYIKRIAVNMIFTGFYSLQDLLHTNSKFFDYWTIMSEPQPEAPRDTGTRMSDLREEIKELVRVPVILILDSSYGTHIDMRTL